MSALTEVGNVRKKEPAAKLARGLGIGGHDRQPAQVSDPAARCERGELDQSENPQPEANLMPHYRLEIGG